MLLPYSARLEEIKAQGGPSAKGEKVKTRTLNREGCGTRLRFSARHFDQGGLLCATRPDEDGNPGECVKDGYPTRLENLLHL